MMRYIIVPRMKVLLCFWPGSVIPLCVHPTWRFVEGETSCPFPICRWGARRMDVVVMMGHDYHSEMRNWESQLVLDFTCHEEGSALQIEDERITKLVMKSWMKTPCDFYDVKVLCDRSTRWTGSSQSLACHQWRDRILDLALRLWCGGPAGCFRRTWWI